MKFYVSILMFLLSFYAQAGSECNLRLGKSVGVKVVEFSTGNVIHSKMSIKDVSADALVEELVGLQDYGICSDTVHSQKCILKFEKAAKTNFISLYRGEDRWLTWGLTSKNKAQDFVKNLKRVGFCS